MINISDDERNILKTTLDAIDDKFGEDIIVLDIRDVSVVADFFVIATCKNKTQTKAVADEVEHKLFEQGLILKNKEGYQNANWILLDFINIIVHLFDPETREFYSLERIWGDVPRFEFDKKLGDKF